MHDVGLGLEILLEGSQPALWDVHVRRETLRFLRKRGQDIPAEQLHRLIEAILQGPPRFQVRNSLTDDEWNQLRYGEIYLRLHKLIESGTKLPSVAQEVYDRLCRDRRRQAHGDHSEEFVYFLSSESGRHVEQRDTAAVENFAEMSVEQFITWSESQSGRPWEYSSLWGKFAEQEIKKSVKLLKGASANNVWPIPAWFKVLGEFEEKGKRDITCAITREVSDILVRMPNAELARLDLEAARWLQGAWQELAKEEVRELWRRIWDASSLNKLPKGHLDRDTTLNNPGGVLAHILYEDMKGCISNVTAGASPGLPSCLRPDFERIAAEVHSTARVARMRIVPMLFVLYRIDPNWTAQAFFRRMDPDNEATFDSCLWEEYFFFGRWSTDPPEPLRPSLLRVLRDSDLISSEVRQRGIARFIHMAVRPDRGISDSEAKSTLWAVGNDGLISAAKALGDVLRGADEKSVALWRDTIGPWFAAVWPKRTQDRSKDLSRALACMAIDSGDAFPYVVKAIHDVLTPEEYNVALDRLNRNIELVSRYPEDALALIDKIVGDDDHGNRSILRELLVSISTAEPELREACTYGRLAEWANTRMD